MNRHEKIVFGSKKSSRFELGMFALREAIFFRLTSSMGLESSILFNESYAAWAEEKGDRGWISEGMTSREMTDNFPKVPISLS